MSVSSSINRRSLRSHTRSSGGQRASNETANSLASRQRRADPGPPGSATPSLPIPLEVTARTAETGLSRQPGDQSTLAAQPNRDTPESRGCTTPQQTETRTTAPRTSGTTFAEGTHRSFGKTSLFPTDAGTPPQAVQRTLPKPHDWSPSRTSRRPDCGAGRRRVSPTLIRSVDSFAPSRSR